MAGKILLEDPMEFLMIREIFPPSDQLDRALPNKDTLHRVVKIVLDNGDVATVEAGYELLRSYRLGVGVGSEVLHSAPHQAALLTIVNIARRALLGGIFIKGNLETPLLVPVPGNQTLAEAVKGLGGQVIEEFPDRIPTLVVGTMVGASSEHPLCLSVMFKDWRGGVAPLAERFSSANSDAIVPAAILAAALGVSEVFQHLRGNPMAGRRRLGLSLWSPQCLDWENAPAGPIEIVLPSRLWLLGLGHLGQAYLWVLGLLPYRVPSGVMLVLQDFDHLTMSNDSTSLLTNEGLIGCFKTRAMAEWAEGRGFKTRIVERPFPGGIRVADDEPRLALGGVDNPDARAAYEDAGFDWIVEAGLGAGPTEYLALRLHTFPATTTARKKWGDVGGHRNPIPATAAYQNLSAQGMDDCGLVRLATRTVGAPFVGTVAASLVVAEVLRFLNGGPATEVIDMTLRDPASRSVVAATRKLKGFNPGFTW
jgi:hypothetical protein